MEDPRMRRYVTAGAMAAALALVLAAPALAQDGSLTITNLLCPTDYAGADYAGDCTEPPEPPLPFQLDGPVSAATETDASGVVTFSGLEAGTYTVTGGVPGDFGTAVVECTASAGEFEKTEDGVTVTLELSADAQVARNWWNVPEDLSGRPPSTALEVPSTPILPIAGLALLITAVGLGARTAASVRRTARD
jgi:hypothetical protein